MSVFTFLREVKAEVEKITWPSFDEFVGHMIVVFVTIMFASVILGGMDYVFSAALKWLFT